MRLFGSDRISGIMERLGIQEGEVLEHPWLNRSIETAQRRVEQQNFSIRKRTLEYDDVMNTQREIIYGFRAEVLRAEDIQKPLFDIVEDVVASRAEVDAEAGKPGLSDFVGWVDSTFPIGLKQEDLPAEATAETMTDLALEKIREAYDLKARSEDPQALAEMERQIILQAIDTHWQEYLRGIDAVRQGVGLRAYGQRDPLVEYKHEAYELFADLMDRIKDDVATRIFRSATSLGALESFLRALPRQAVHNDVSALGAAAASQPRTAGAPGAGTASGGADEAMQQALAQAATPMRRDQPKVGRNDPCPCGSGKKYKKCCGAAVTA